MNRIVGYWAFDRSVDISRALNASRFKTPHWNPDHYDVYLNGEIALSATQRFITPQCHLGLMPFKNKDTGCVINADVYLTNREELCDLLGVNSQVADAVLLLEAYLKWGEACTQYLAGQFCFLIWDPRYQPFFATVIAPILR
jgi:asparagine synthase (glutamine-hydrolysing)